jgi:hypothetical protein
MNQGVRRRALMKKARGKSSRVSVPLKREAPTTMTVSSELKLIS